MPDLSSPSSRQEAPLWNWLSSRGSGVLMHPTALPGGLGVGTLDKNASDFLQFLSKAGFRYWQTCPLGPTGFGDSPYQCFSSFAGNPYLIDLGALVAHKLLPLESLAPLQSLPADSVDFGALYRLKWPLLFRAHAEFVRGKRLIEPYGNFAAFIARSSVLSWLLVRARTAISCA